EKVEEEAEPRRGERGVTRRPAGDRTDVEYGRAAHRDDVSGRRGEQVDLAVDKPVIRIEREPVQDDEDVVGVELHLGSLAPVEGVLDRKLVQAEGSLELPKLV